MRMYGIECTDEERNELEENFILEIFSMKKKIDKSTETCHLVTMQCSKCHRNLLFFFSLSR